MTQFVFLKKSTVVPGSGGKWKTAARKLNKRTDSVIMERRNLLGKTVIPGNL